VSNRFRKRAFRFRLPARLRTLLGESSALAMVAISVTLAGAQSPVRIYRRAHERQIIAEFTRLCEIPNLASDSQNIRRNAEFIREMMQRRGLNPRLLETASKESPPTVYGEWKTPGATHSIVLYAHYDGQPTDPKQWTETLPWQPVWRSAALESGGKMVGLPDGAIDPEWRLYARSSSDDKAGVMASLTAFDALRAQGITPSLNINGISSGDVGALARNVIPTTATAVLDLRLVKGNDHRRQAQRLMDHIRKQGFYVIDRDPTDDDRKQHALIAKVIVRSGGYNAERTRMDLPISVALITAVQSTSTQTIVRLPTAGGSLPLSIITDHLRTVTMTVPIANYDNNQHAENEILRLQNLWDGIETLAAVMIMKPAVSHR